MGFDTSDRFGNKFRIDPLKRGEYMRELAPDAIRVTALPDYQLKILFSNGETRIFDAVPLLRRKCYAALKNVKLFMQAEIVNGCITWPNDLDIDPDWLYEDSVINA